MSKAKKQLDLDFAQSGKQSPEPRFSSAEHTESHTKGYTGQESHEDAPVAEGEHPPIGSLDAHIAHKLAESPEACAKHIEEGLRALREEPSEANRLSLRRRLREVARAWGIPVSGRD